MAPLFEAGILPYNIIKAYDITGTPLPEHAPSAKVRVCLFIRRPWNRRRSPVNQQNIDWLNDVWVSISFCLYSVDICATQAPCLNGGTCTSTIAGSQASYQCTCSSAWTGVNCESPVNLCLGQPCFNEGTCQMNNVNGQAGFRCFCRPVWTGTTCIVPVNVCDGQNQCRNGGTCLSNNRDNVPGFLCVCPQEWTGTMCENPGKSELNRRWNSVMTSQVYQRQPQSPADTLWMQLSKRNHEIFDVMLMGLYDFCKRFIWKKRSTSGNVWLFGVFFCENCVSCFFAWKSGVSACHGMSLNVGGMSFL